MIKSFDVTVFRFRLLECPILAVIGGNRNMEPCSTTYLGRYLSNGLYYSCLREWPQRLISCRLDYLPRLSPDHKRQCIGNTALRPPTDLCSLASYLSIYSTFCLTQTSICSTRNLFPNRPPASAEAQHLSHSTVCCRLFVARRPVLAAIFFLITTAL